MFVYNIPFKFHLLRKEPFQTSLSMFLLMEFVFISFVWNWNGYKIRDWPHIYWIGLDGMGADAMTIILIWYYIHSGLDVIRISISLLLFSTREKERVTAVLICLCLGWVFCPFHLIS